MKRSITFFPALVAAALLTSCATPIRPLSSTPPAAKIRVNKPFKWGDGVLTIKVDMPAGDYTPRYEDENGYYYDAPQKVTGWDSFWPILVEGGLYFEKGVSKPDQIYVIRNNLGVPAKVNIGDRADLTLLKK